MTTEIEAPITWLWRELEQHMTADYLARLRAGYQAQAKRYGRASEIRRLTRLIRERDKWEQTPRVVKSQERARAKLARLTGET